MIRRGAAKQKQDRAQRAASDARRGGNGRAGRAGGAGGGSATPAAAPPPGAVRLQRVMADAGVASRRECEAMIEGGQVEVNGEVVTTLPVFVNPRTDRIVVAGRPLPRPGRGKGPKGETGVAGSRRIYVMLNKPARTLTTTHDEAGRRTVMDLVEHPSEARLYPVGRLGFETTGLLLLTNDGELTSRLTHARYGVPKTYRAEVKGDVDEAALHRLEREALRGERRARRTRRSEIAPLITRAEEGPTPSAGRVSMRIVKREAGRTIIEIVMAEGGNRQVERVLGEAGWPVKKLACIAVGPIRLSEVAPGEWRELERDEIRALKQAAGLGGKGRGPKAAAGHGEGGAKPRRPRAAPSSAPKGRGSRGAGVKFGARRGRGGDA